MPFKCRMLLRLITSGQPKYNWKEIWQHRHKLHKSLITNTYMSTTLTIRANQFSEHAKDFEHCLLSKIALRINELKQKVLQKKGKCCYQQIHYHVTVGCVVIPRSVPGQSSIIHISHISLWRAGRDRNVSLTRYPDMWAQRRWIIGNLQLGQV